MTYIDFLKTPCHPWNGGSVNKLHLLGDYVEVSGNDLSDQKKHCEDSRCHLLSPDCEPLSLQFTPMRSYNPHFAGEKMRQRWVKCCKAIHPVRGLKWSEVTQLASEYFSFNYYPVFGHMEVSQLYLIISSIFFLVVFRYFVMFWKAFSLPRLWTYSLQVLVLFIFYG